MLGLLPGASYEEIRATYRRLTRQYHPDNALTGDRERWQRIRAAYEALIPSQPCPPPPAEEGPGRHLRRDHEVPFLAALYGHTVTFQHRGREVSIKLPPGVETGQRIRVAGQGEDGKPPGDLFVDLRILPHRHLLRVGLNLEAELRLTWHEAAAGGPIQIPTPWGRFWLRFGRGEANEGTEFILDGYGVRKADGTRGDLIYTTTLVAPQWASRTLLDELRLLQQADAPRVELEASFQTNHPPK